MSTISTGVLATTLVSRALEQRLAAQLDHAAAMVSSSGFALNRPVLERLRSVLDAEIVTLDGSRRAIVSTIGAGMPALLDAVRAAAPGSDPSSRVAVIELAHGGRPYKVAYRRLDDPPDSILAVVASAADLQAAKRAVATTIALLTGGVALLVAFVSHRIARGITAPIDELVAVTRRLGTGEREARAIVRDDGEIAILAAAINDMADQLRISEARRLESERLAAAGRLAAGVAHDVRNPLSSMKMHMQLLRAKLGGRDATREVVGAILHDIDRVEWVVRGLLDLVRPAALDLKPARAEDLVAEALLLTEPQLVHRKIAVDRRFAPDVPAVMVDPQRITQALLNLILNAAEAMPEGGLLVARTERGTGACVTIELADDGVGIDPEIHPRVFEPFITTKRDGVGLGLVNARNAIEQHGGRLELLPRDGGGTRAVVCLPVSPAPGA